MASPRETFRRFSPLPVGIVALTYCLIILGATTRLEGAGLSCPDWPLCNGKLIPTFDHGVFFEWSHRLVAGTVSTLFLVMLSWILVNGSLRSRLWRVAVFAVVMLATQVVLGGLTVLDLVKPYIVTMHLGTGTLLFSSLILICLRTLREYHGYEPAATQPRGLKPFAVLTLLGVYGQILLGGLVASNYASLACPDWPTCQGMWFPPLVGFVGLHMVHRYGAYTVATLVSVLFVWTRKSQDAHVRILAAVAFGLVLIQVALGVSIVLLRLPIPLAAAHNGVAEALFATLVAVNYGLFSRSRAQDVREPALAQAVAR